MTSRTAAGGMKLFSARFGVSMFSLVFYGVAAHTLDRAELAPLAAMAVIAELFRVVRSFGVPQSMLQRVPQSVAKDENDNAAWLIRRTMLITVGVSIPAVALAWHLRDAISQAILKQPADAAQMFVILGFALMMSTYDALQLALLALQRFGRQSGAYVVTMGGQRILALVLLFVYGIDGVLAGFLIGAIIGNVLCVFWLRDYLFGAFKRTGDGFIRLWRYSIPYYGQEFARYIFHEADQFFVGLLLSPELLANYFIAKRIAHGLRMLIDSAADVMRPKMGELSAMGDDAVKEGFARASRFMSYLAMPVTLGIAAISGPLILFYAGAEYRDAGALALSLSIAMLFYAYFSLYEVSLYMLGRPAHRFYADLCVAGATLVAFFIMVGPLRDMGIALALTAGFAFGLGMSVLMLRGIADLRIDRAALARTFRASGAMFIIWSLLTLRPPELWYYPVVLIAGLILFVRLFAASMPSERVEEIRDALPTQLEGQADLLYLMGAEKPKSASEKFSDQPPM